MFTLDFSKIKRASVNIFIFRSSHQSCSILNGVLRNFAKFTAKHLCQGLFFNVVAGQACKFIIKKETVALYYY